MCADPTVPAQSAAHLNDASGVHLLSPPLACSVKCDNSFLLNTGSILQAHRLCAFACAGRVQGGCFAAFLVNQPRCSCRRMTCCAGLLGLHIVTPLSKVPNAHGNLSAFKHCIAYFTATLHSSSHHRTCEYGCTLTGLGGCNVMPAAGMRVLCSAGFCCKRSTRSRFCVSTRSIALQALPVWSTFGSCACLGELGCLL
jgi:hypothetical protein